MCVFPKVLIIIIFMGGGANPQNIFTLCAQNETALRAVCIKISYLTPPEQNPEYAPDNRNIKQVKQRND